MTLLKKLVAMAILGAIGAAIGAGMGEMLFADEAPPRTEPRKICLLFDISGSMGDRISRHSGRSVSQLSALQDASSDFLKRQDLSIDPVGLAVFSSDAHVVNKLTDDADDLDKSIGRLYANGGTNLGRVTERMGGFLAQGKTPAGLGGYDNTGQLDRVFFYRRGILD